MGGGGGESDRELSGYLISVRTNDDSFIHLESYRNFVTIRSENLGGFLLSRIRKKTKRHL